MKKIALATVAAFFASVVAAEALPGTPAASGMSETGMVQVKAKKKMHTDKNMKGHRGMKGMKGGDMKTMKGM